MKTTSSSSTRFTVLALFGIFVLSLVYLHSVYASLTIAFVLAYLLEPVVRIFEKLKLPRALSSILTLAIFFGFMTLLVLLMSPKIVGQGHQLILRIPKAVNTVVTTFTPISEEYLGYNVFKDVNQAVKDIGDPTKFVQPVGQILRDVFSTTFGFVITVLGFLIVPLMAFWLLREFDGLWGKVMYVIPKRHHRLALDIQKRLGVVFGGFIRGQLVVSTVLSIYYSIAFSIAGLELWLVLGLMAGFFNVIPYLGILTVLILTLLTAFIQGVSPSLYVGLLAIFGVGFAMEGSILTPKIVGSRVGLHPLVLIIALLCGGTLLGLVGMLLAVPIAAMGKVFLDVAIQKYRSSPAFKRS